MTTSNNKKYVLKMNRLSDANQSYQYKASPVVVAKKRDSRHFIVINEERLISSVQARPILFDKALKGYRKPTLREQAWQEVAEAVSSTVEESKKRWRSLRDAFMKQYKQISNDDPLLKKKKWLFYDQMEFLGPYLELNYGTSTFNQYNPNATDYETDKNTEEFLCKGEYSEHDQDSSDDKQLTYCVLQPIDSSEEILDLDEAEHMDDCSDQAEVVVHEEEEIIDIYDDSEIISDIFPKPNSSDNEQANVLCDNPHTTEQQQQNMLIVSSDSITTAAATTTTSNSTQVSKIELSAGDLTLPSVSSFKESDNNTSIPTTSEQYSTSPAYQTDSDEKFLLSCAPILRRLSDKKNCMARLRIQQILYEIEFGDLNEVLF